MSRSELRKLKHKPRSGPLPYETVLGRTVKIKREGQVFEVTAEEAFILYLESKADRDVTAAMLLEQTQNENDKLSSSLVQHIREVRRRIISPGSVTYALELLRMARKFERNSKRPYLKLEPWIVERALARFGDKQLSKDEQQVILAATRTPHKVNWPDWWTERPDP